MSGLIQRGTLATWQRNSPAAISITRIKRANMRTNGLALSVAIAVAFGGYGRAAEETISGGAPASDKVVASEHPETLGTSDAAEPAMCSQDLDTRILPDGARGWQSSLIGSTCGYHLYAGTEFTLLNVHSQ